MHFFATAADMNSVVASIESTRQLDYYEAGLFDSPIVTLHRSVLSIPAFTLSAESSAVECVRYLTLNSPSNLEIRSIPQKRGGIKYAIDQLVNPESLIIQLGGIYQNGILVVGSLGTAHKSAFSTNLLSAYRRHFKKQFQKTSSGVFIGPEATILLKEGWRLVFDAGQPKEYDLQKEAPHTL